MNIKVNVKKYLLFAFFAVVAFLGAHLIGVLNSTNPIIARGIIGLAIIYQLVMFGLIPGETEPIEPPFKFLKDFRFWLKVFLGGGVFYWALQQIFIMIAELF